MNLYKVIFWGFTNGILLGIAIVLGNIAYSLAIIASSVQGG